MTQTPPLAIDCETAVRRLWDFLDGELDAGRYAEVESHVAACSGCASHVAFANAFLAAVRDSWRQTSPPTTSLRDRIVHRLANDGFRTTGEAAR